MVGSLGYRVGQLGRKVERLVRGSYELLVLDVDRKHVMFGNYETVRTGPAPSVGERVSVDISTFASFGTLSFPVTSVLTSGRKTPLVIADWEQRAEVIAA